MHFSNPTANAIREALLQLSETSAWRTYDGANLERLRESLGSLFDRKHVRLCSSGTLGVEIALRSLNLPPNSEVMLAGYDYPGNFRSIEDAGSAVALYDLQPNGWTTGVEQLEAAVGPNTRAVIVSHLHGSLAPMKSICEWAHSRGLVVVEDACQEPAAMIDGRRVGSWGDLSVLSFGGSKLLSAGRGGAVMTNDSRLAQRMTIYCERGNDAYALSELQAAVLVPQIQSLVADNELRRSAAERLTASISNIEWMRPCFTSTNGSASYFKFGLMLDAKILGMPRLHKLVQDASPLNPSPIAVARDLALKMLLANGLDIGLGFRGFLSRSESRCRRNSELKNSRVATDSTLVLSHSHLLDPETGESTVGRVSDCLHSLDKAFNG